MPCKPSEAAGVCEPDKRSEALRAYAYGSAASRIPSPMN